MADLCSFFSILSQAIGGNTKLQQTISLKFLWATSNQSNSITDIGDVTHLSVRSKAFDCAIHIYLIEFHTFIFISTIKNDCDILFVSLKCYFFQILPGRNSSYSSTTTTCVLIGTLPFEPEGRLHDRHQQMKSGSYNWGGTCFHLKAQPQTWLS